MFVYLTVIFGRLVLSNQVRLQNNYFLFRELCDICQSKQSEQVIGGNVICSLRKNTYASRDYPGKLTHA